MNGVKFVVGMENEILTSDLMVKLILHSASVQNSLPL